MYHCGMRQVEERHVANQVDLMVWSNRLDLLAISNFKGEVQVHRLHWQKVWNLPPPKEDLTVRAIAWRPDGKVGLSFCALAIGYSSGSVYIVDIEDKQILDKYNLEVESSEEFNDTKHYGISCITWTVCEGSLKSATEYNDYDDPSNFLQKPLSVGGGTSGFKNQTPEDDTIRDFKVNKEYTHLNMLLVGYGTGYIYMSIFGKYPYGTIHLAQVTKDDCGEFKVMDICLSDDFSVMQVCYMDRVTNNLFVSLINTSVLSAYAEEIFTVAKWHSQVAHLISYLDHTMVSITEAWEHILLEMDTKMYYYAASVPENGVSADLLELLMLGVPSDELELFLLQELTAKGLKKFGSSVELSYSTIQRLVLRQLKIVGQSLTYYLAELRGLTRIPDRYKILGLEESKVTEAIKACCAFLNKSMELQQVIDTSMRNYKAFFRWLFVVIVRLLDEQTPSEIVKITQQELTHIAEFLYNFDNIQTEASESTSDKPVKFNLERLGQYLQDQDLTILPDDEDNPWHKFMKDNSCLIKDSETIFSMQEFRKYSLVQQQKFLKDAINKVFDVSDKDVGIHFSVLFNIKCYEVKGNVSQDNDFRISQIFDYSKQRFMMSFLHRPSTGFYFMSVDIGEKECESTAVKYYFSSDFVLEGDKKVGVAPETAVDLQFYSSEYLSLLTEHPHDKDSSVFIQVPLQIAVDNSAAFNIKSKAWVFTDAITSKDLTPLVVSSLNTLQENMDGLQIAVCGSRKVAVILSKSHRKVRIFEMEVEFEDEEDETLDTTPQSQVTQRSDGQETPDKQNTSNEEEKRDALSNITEK